VLLHVVDASHPGWDEQYRIVEQVLVEIGIEDRPVVPVFNKMDTVRDPAALTTRVKELYPDAVLTSTMRIDGLEPLKAALRAREQEIRPPVTVRLPMSDGARLAALYRHGEVLGLAASGDQNEITVRLDGWRVEQLRKEGVEVVVSRPRRRRAGAE